MRDVGELPVASKMVHDLNLAAHILDIVLVNELPGGNGLAGELLFGLLVGHQVGNAELSPPQLPTEDVCGPDVLHGAAEHTADVGASRLGLVLSRRRMEGTGGLRAGRG